MSQNIIIGLIAVSLLALIVVNVSSCGCNNNENSENYIPEYTGNSPNYKTCSNSYRLYTDSAENTDSYPRNRCQFCKGYNSVESFVDTTGNFKLCPHNCRQYGVASCDQGNML